MPAGFREVGRCPFCKHEAPPVRRLQINPAYFPLVMTAILLSCCPFFLVVTLPAVLIAPALFMRRRILCANCGKQLGRETPGPNGWQEDPEYIPTVNPCQTAKHQ